MVCAAALPLPQRRPQQSPDVFRRSASLGGFDLCFGFARREAHVGERAADSPDNVGGARLARPSVAAAVGVSKGEGEAGAGAAGDAELGAVDGAMMRAAE